MSISPDELPARGSKPVLKVVVGNHRAYRPSEVCYIYLIKLPGFQKLGHSTNPEKVLDQFAGGHPLLDQVRAFHDRREAMTREKELHRKYVIHRIDKHGRGWVGGRYLSKRYSPDAEINI
jgi:hypothetical protein